MHQIRSLSPLGSRLRQARKEARLTQPELAARVVLAVPTLRQAERGLGTLSTFATLAACLGLELSGRSLPPGESLGTRMSAMRTRRGWSLRDLAEKAGISPTTLAALEHGGRSHLRTAIRVGEALGVHLCLVPVGTPASFWASAGTSMAHQGWTSPADVLERLYQVIGGDFDLDPCSPCRRGPVQARLRYTVEDDGLVLPWKGIVFLNPPYGRGLPDWTSKACTEVKLGRAETVVALIPARTDTRWWHEHVVGHAQAWMLKGRLKFGDGTQSAPFPSALVAWGMTEEHSTRMTAAFPDAWHVRPW